MKRVKAACICQTLHFMLKEDVDRETAISLVEQEVAAYKTGLDRKKTLYRILEETREPDGSIIIRIIKQYNQSDVGEYLD